MAKIANAFVVAALVAIIRVLNAIRVRKAKRSTFEKSLGNLSSSLKVERLSVSQPQQLWWVMPIEGGIVVQQLMCSKDLELPTMMLGAVKHFTKTTLPTDPLRGILVCCGLGRSHPVSVFGSVGSDDGWEYFTCPLCEASYRKKPYAK